MKKVARLILFVSLAAGLGLSLGCQDYPEKIDDVDGGNVVRGEKVNTDEFPQVANSIYGGWSTGPEAITDPSMASVRLQVFLNSSGTVVYSMACPFTDGFTLYAKALLNATLIGNRLTLSNPMSSRYSDGTRVCTVDVPAGTYTYTIEGGRLHSSHASNGDVYYSRLKY